MTTLKEVLISMVIMSGIVLGFMGVLTAGVTQNINPNIQNIAIPDTLNSLNKINDITTQVQGQDTALTEAFSQIPYLGSEAAVILGGLAGTLGTALTLPAVFQDMVVTVGTAGDITIPTWVQDLVLAIVSIFVIFIGVRIMAGGDV